MPMIVIDSGGLLDMAATLRGSASEYASLDAAMYSDRVAPVPPDLALELGDVLDQCRGLVRQLAAEYADDASDLVTRAQVAENDLGLGNSMGAVYGTSCCASYQSAAAEVALFDSGGAGYESVLVGGATIWSEPWDDTTDWGASQAQLAGWTSSASAASGSGQAFAPIGPEGLSLEGLFPVDLSGSAPQTALIGGSGLIGGAGFGGIETTSIGGSGLIGDGGFGGAGSISIGGSGFSAPVAGTGGAGSSIGGGYGPFGAADDGSFDQILAGLQDSSPMGPASLDEVIVGQMNNRDPGSRLY